MAYYQLENGYAYTSKQYKRNWPGGKVPTPLQRRMLGIKTLTKKQYDALPAHLKSKKRNPGLPAFKITTSSGYSWVTSMAKNVTLADAKKYFMGKYVDVGDYPQEKMEKVVKVTKSRRNPGPSETSYGVDPNAITRKVKPYKPTGKSKKSTKSTTRRMKAPKKNPSHKGSLTDARNVAKQRLHNLPFGTVVMIGQWIDTGKYEAKVGGGSNWAHEYFMPVEQWTSVRYKTKPGKKMVKQTIKKNPGGKVGGDWQSVKIEVPGTSKRWFFVDRAFKSGWRDAMEFIDRNNHKYTLKVYTRNTSNFGPMWQSAGTYPKTKTKTKKNPSRPNTVPATPGTKIIFESVNGILVPGKIVRMKKDRYGMEEIEWEVTRRVGAYRKGSKHTSSPNWVHPAANVRRTKLGTRVTPVRWRSNPDYSHMTRGGAALLKKKKAYTHFVCIGGEIESGWEYKEDADDRKQELADDDIKAKVYTRKYLEQRKNPRRRKNPHDKSMFGEDGPDWLIYAKAPGMSRFEPLDLSEGGTVKNLMYASRFPYSQEAKVDRIVAKLNKDNKRIKFEKRRS